MHVYSPKNPPYDAKSCLCKSDKTSAFFTLRIPLELPIQHNQKQSEDHDTVFCTSNITRRMIMHQCLDFYEGSFSRMMEMFKYFLFNKRAISLKKAMQKYYVLSVVNKI